MDCGISDFQSGLDSQPAFSNLPPRRLTMMPASQIVAWTPARMLAAFTVWLLEETWVPDPVTIRSNG